MKNHISYLFFHYLGRFLKKIGLSSLGSSILFVFKNRSSEKVQQRLNLINHIEKSRLMDEILTKASSSEESWLSLEQQQDLLKTINITKNLQLFKDYWPGLYFSQEGEDVLLEKLLQNKPMGSYLEIGAHHPLRFSNTAHFYLKGWRGIVVDPDTRNQGLFKQCRPDDIFLPYAIGKQKEKKTFYFMKEGALNSFDKTYIDWLVNERGYELLETKEVETVPLHALVELYPQIQSVDFLSLDVEGHELEVLQSNNWNVFRPKLIVTEILNSSLNSIDKSPVHELLRSQEYSIISKLENSVIYKHTIALT